MHREELPRTEEVQKGRESMKYLITHKQLKRFCDSRTPGNFCTVPLAWMPCTEKKCPILKKCEKVEGV
jgi:hypothetical protein